MAWIAPTIGLATTLLAGNPNSAGDELAKQQAGMLRLNKRRAKQYLPQYDQYMQNAVFHPTDNPLYRMLLNQANAGAQEDYRTAGTDMLMNNSLRGGGMSGTSSVGTNLSLALAQGKADALAKMRFGLAGEAMGRSQGLAQGQQASMLGSSSMAAGGYGQMANQAYDQSSQWGPAVQGLMQAIFAGQGGNNPTVPAAGSNDFVFNPAVTTTSDNWIRRRLGATQPV